MRRFLILLTVIIFGMSLSGCRHKLTETAPLVVEEEKTPGWQTGSRNGAILLFSEDDQLAAIAEGIKRQTACPVYDTKTLNTMNIEDYNVLFLGFTEDGERLPETLTLFLKTNTFSDTAVIPFSVSNSDHDAELFFQTAQDCQGAVILDGFENKEETFSSENIESWLNSIGMIE